MAIALVSHLVARSAAGGSITSGSLDTTGANLLVWVMADYGAAAATTPTDSKGNTWLGLTEMNHAAYLRGRIYYAKNPIVGTGHTFTSTAVGNNYPSFEILAFSGADTAAPFDVQNGSASQGTTAQAGSVTPSENNELVIAGVAFDVADTFTINLGFTISDQSNMVGGVAFGSAAAYLIQTTAGAVNPTWTRGSSNLNEAVIASFKSAAAAAQGLVHGARPDGYTGQCQMHALLAT